MNSVLVLVGGSLLRVAGGGCTRRVNAVHLRSSQEVRRADTQEGRREEDG